jgi:hypothetical protein
MSYVNKTRHSVGPFSEPCKKLSELSAGDVVLIARPLFEADWGAQVNLVKTWCPFCHKNHIHRWPRLDMAPDTVFSFPAHCRREPLRNGHLYLILDPDRNAENQPFFTAAANAPPRRQRVPRKTFVARPLDKIASREEPEAR